MNGPCHRVPCHRVLLRALLLLYGFGVSATPLAAQTPFLRQILEKNFESVAALRSETYTARVKNSDGGEWQAKYLRSRDMYRIERVDLSPTLVDGEPNHSPYDVWAFDGKNYQSQSRERKLLKITTTGSGVGSADPVLEPYRWIAAIQCVAPSRADFLKISYWEAAFANAVVVGESKVDSKPCVEVEFSQRCSGPACYFRVHFHTDGSFYPIKYERRVASSHKLATESIVHEWQIVDGGTQRVRMPLRISRMTTDADQISRVGTVETVLHRESIEVNQPLADGVFTLEKAPDQLVYDVQEQEESYARSREIRDSLTIGPLVSIGRGRYVLALVVVLFAFSLLYVIWRSK